MALTDVGKKVAMGGPGVFGVTRYLILLVSANVNDELAGHGYLRKAIATSARVVAANGEVTISNLDVYTASDNNAQDATHVSIADALDAGDLLYDPEPLDSNPDAPTVGQTFRLTSITFRP